MPFVLPNYEWIFVGKLLAFKKLHFKHPTSFPQLTARPDNSQTIPQSIFPSPVASAHTGNAFLLSSRSQQPPVPLHTISPRILVIARNQRNIQGPLLPVLWRKLFLPSLHSPGTEAVKTKPMNDFEEKRGTWGRMILRADGEWFGSEYNQLASFRETGPTGTSRSGQDTPEEKARPVQWHGMPVMWIPRRSYAFERMVAWWGPHAGAMKKISKKQRVAEKGKHPILRPMTSIMCREWTGDWQGARKGVWREAEVFSQVCNCLSLFLNTRTSN